jgi:hypothetical protein
MRENPEPRAIPSEGRHRLVGRRLVRRCLLGRRPFRRRPFRLRRPFLRLSRGRRRVPPVSKRTGERTLLALSNFAQHGASSHAITKREGLRRVVVKMARQPEAVAAACGAAGAAKLSRNESGHPGRQSRRLPMCPSRRVRHAPIRHQSSPRKEAQSQGTLTRRRSAVASSRPHPMASRRRLFAVGQPSADGVCPRRRGRCVAVAFIVRSSSRVPGLAQQGDDLDLAPLPCVVECRLAAPVALGSELRIGSQRRICSSFEETLGDREVTVVCRAMQS